jgi:hypothetical protein
MPTQNVTRIYTGPDGESHFEDLQIELSDLGAIGAMSKPLAAQSILFRETGADYDLGFHSAPRRQFVIMLSGGRVELEVGSGEKRVLGPGDVLLAEDTTGRGHISRALDPEPRRSIFVALE